jgi:hypothetical protein
MFTRCVLYHVAGFASVFAVLESPLPQSLDVGVPAMLRREAPREEEPQRWEIREAGSMVVSPKHLQSSSSGHWRIQLKAGSSTRDIVSFLDLGTPHAVRQLLEHNKHALKNLRLEGRQDPVEATLKSNESASDQRVFDVACDPGWTVVGGGCLGRHSNDQVEGSRDLSVNAFRCESVGDCEDCTKKVFAICAESCATLLDEYDGPHDRFAAHDDCPEIPSDDGTALKEVIDPHHICGDQYCTLEECCRAPPTCSSFSGSCSESLPVRKSSDTICSSWSCSVEDCCRPPEMCMAWAERRFPNSDPSDACKGFEECLINIGDFSTKVCAGSAEEPGLCKKVECCTAAATCKTFDGAMAGCVHDASEPRKSDDTCCDQSEDYRCRCEDCYR